MNGLIKQVVSLLPKPYHLQKTVINSKFIIYIITTLSDANVLIKLESNKWLSMKW